MDTSRTRLTELRSEFLVRLKPLVNHSATWHLYIGADLRERLALFDPIDDGDDDVILKG